MWIQGLSRRYSCSRNAIKLVVLTPDGMAGEFATSVKGCATLRDELGVTWVALPGLRGGGGLIMRPGRQRGRRAGLCRAGGYCGPIERSPDRRAASPGKCRGAGVARSAATTRTLPGY